MTFLRALGGILTLIIIVVLGFVLSRRGWFTPDFRKILPRLVTVVSLPPFLACTIISSFQRDNLAQMIYGIAAPFIGLCLLFGLGYVLGKILRVNRHRFGLFCAAISNPNTIFIGIPVNIALFGRESLPYALLYYFASTIFFWTAGNYFISRDEPSGEVERGQGQKPRGFRWNVIISPPLMGFLFGLTIVCAQLEIPSFIFQAAFITGEMTTPLALIFIGITLERTGLRNLYPDRDMAVALVGRMIISPLVMWELARLFALPDLMAKVFIIQSSLPVLTQLAILSAYYNTDPEYGSLMVALSTILCAFTIPVYMVLM